MQYGQSYTIRTSQARQIMWVQLLRPIATTYSSNTEQRLVDIPLEYFGICELHIQVLNKRNVAPPG